MLFLCAPQGAAALNVGSGTGSAASPTLVEPHQVRETALEAFRDSAQRLGRQQGDGAADPGTMAKAIDRAVEDFSRALRKRIDDLRGDGVLTATEVSDDVGDLREQHLDELREAIDALRQGYDPPPRADAYDQTWPHVRAVLDYTFLVRNSGRDWARLLGFTTAGLALAWLLSKAIRAGGRRLRRHNLAWAGYLIESMTGPLYLTAASIGVYAGLQPIWLPGIAERPLELAVDAVVALAIFWFLWHAAKAMAAGLAWLFGSAELHQMDKHVVVVIARVLRVILVGAFFVVLVQQILDSDLTGLVAGLGVLGVALLLILKSSVENIVASFTIFGDAPFRVGDLVIYDGIWGHIEDIGFRSTKFRTFDGYLLTLPNAKLLNEVLSNVGARPSVRRRFRVSLPYDTPPAKVREAIDILRDILHDHRGQPADSPPHVVFEAYGNYDLRLLVQYHYEPPDYWGALEFDTEVNLQILERFNDAGIDFAFPTQTTVLTSDPDQPPQLRMQSADAGQQG